MKEHLLYILIFFSICGYGQFESNSFELDSMIYFFTIDSDTIQGKYYGNYTSTGYLMQFRKLNYKRKALRPLIPFDSIQYDYDSQLDCLYEGEIKNGVKTGEWITYFTFGTYYCEEQVVWPLHVIDYREDTIVFENGIWPFNKKITYVNDSSEVFGQTSTKSDYLIEFKCINKDKCLFWITNPKQIIDSSSYAELVFKLTQFEIGEYDRTIRKIVNE